MSTSLEGRAEEHHVTHTVCKRFQTEYKEETGTNVQINCADKKIVLVGNKKFLSIKLYIQLEST